MMEVPFNMEGYTCKELEEIVYFISAEAKKRKTAAMFGEWNVVKNTIKSWIKNYGNIEVAIPDEDTFCEADISFNDEPGKIIMKLLY